MKEHRCVCERILGSVERFLTERSPREGLRFALQSLKQVVEVCGCVRNKFSVITDHAEKSLELLNRRRLCACADGGHLFRKWSYAVLVDGISEKIERGFAEDTLRPLYDQTVGRQRLEDGLEVLEVLLERLRGDQDIVYIDIDSREVAEDLIHEPLKILPRILEAEGCAGENKQPKGGNDGGLFDVFIGDGDLMIPFHQIHLREEFFPAQLGCKIL